MNLAERIQKLRKARGLSQEELAQEIGVSRQAVSKWESMQSAPDMEKIVVLSDFFEVTTDYLLKGTEAPETAAWKHQKQPDTRIYMAAGTAINLIGLIAAIGIWFARQTVIALVIGFSFMILGCVIFQVGQWKGIHREESKKRFFQINVWILTLMPLSCMFNVVQGMLGGYWGSLMPLPQLGNALWPYGLFWLFYIVLCAVVGRRIKG